MSVAIHYDPVIRWQADRLPAFCNCLNNLGITYKVTTSRQKISDYSILFGTTLWRQVESEPGFLLVDRASIGDPHYVQLVWNGHGRRGDHKVPDGIDDSRWNQLGVDIRRPVNGYLDTVICGQTETYSPDWSNMNDWYSSIEGATHFRPHPSRNRENPTGLPFKRDWALDKYHVLNSSVGVDAIIRGLHVKIHDAGSLAYGIDDLTAWSHWLAWTQWNWSEIASGLPISHLFEDI